jgi:Protein of unknown function (DUF3611)
MKNKSETIPPASKTLKRISFTLKLAGTIGFWTQLVLGVVAGVTLLFTAPGLAGGQESSQGLGFGVFFAISGIIALAISIYFFFRYTEMSRLLSKPDPSPRPTKTDTLRVINSKFSRLVSDYVGGTSYSWRCFT